MSTINTGRVHLHRLILIAAVWLLLGASEFGAGLLAGAYMHG